GHVERPRSQRAPNAAWRGDEAAAIDFMLLLSPDDLPTEPFGFGAGCTVVDRARFLARFKADARRGPAGPPPRFGALQAEVVRLRRLLLDGVDGLTNNQVTVQSDRWPISKSDSVTSCAA